MHRFQCGPCRIYESRRLVLPRTSWEFLVLYFLRVVILFRPCRRSVVARIHVSCVGLRSSLMMMACRSHCGSLAPRDLAMDIWSHPNVSTKNAKTQKIYLKSSEHDMKQGARFATMDSLPRRSQRWRQIIAWHCGSPKNKIQNFNNSNTELNSSVR
jgi:hypothetical protein